MKTIASSQEQFDVIPYDFSGEIEIRFGNSDEPAIVNRRFSNAVVQACDNAVVQACDNAKVVAYGNAMVCACGNAKVRACDNAVVWAYDNAKVWASNNAKVQARGNAKVLAYGNAMVWARNNQEVETHDQAVVYYGPLSAEQFCNFFGVATTDHGTAIMYKAAHKREGFYYSDYDSSFRYKACETIRPEFEINTDIKCSCGSGIHCATLEWAEEYGNDWYDGVILEVEVPLDGVVVPERTDGKVRVPWAKILREVKPEV